MLRITFVLIVCACFVSQFVYAKSSEPLSSIELKDAENDVRNSEHPGKDVVKVSINSDGKYLLVKAILKDDIQHYLNSNMAGTVIQIHFDVDNNRETGGKIFWTKNSGFEYVVSVRSCILYDKGEACVGGLGDKITGFFSSYLTKKYGQGSNSATDVHDYRWESSKEKITGNSVATKIPYDEIGVVSGQIIRIVIEEKDSLKPKEAYSSDIFFALK